MLKGAMVGAVLRGAIVSCGIVSDALSSALDHQP